MLGPYGFRIVMRAKSTKNRRYFGPSELSNDSRTLCNEQQQNRDSHNGEDTRDKSGISIPTTKSFSPVQQNRVSYSRSIRKEAISHQHPLTTNPIDGRTPPQTHLGIIPTFNYGRLEIVGGRLGGLDFGSFSIQ